MKSAIITEAWKCIGDLTPLKTDCGERCGHACCLPDEDDQGGVYLFPGEEALIGEINWGEILPGDNQFAPMMVCEGACDRKRRPYACRIFPLTPVKRPDGRWGVRMDVRARPMCPLVKTGLKGLDPAFVKAVAKSVSILAKDPEMEAFLQKWQALEEEYRFVL